MKGYILAVAGAVLLSAAFTVLLPQGKTGKFLKGMLRLVVVAVAVAPFVSLLSEKEFSFRQDLPGSDAGYLAACAQMISGREEKELALFLEREFSVEAETEVRRGTEEGFPLQKVKIIVRADGIFGEEAHIDMAERIGRAAAEELGCGGEIVEVTWNG